MSVAKTVKDYLAEKNIDYDVVHHPYSEGAVQSAIAAQVPLGNMTKAVVLEDHEGRHLMAVLPASRKLRVRKLGDMLERSFKLVPEADVFDLFTDCLRGAIPALGAAYQMETVFDDNLAGAGDLYVEAGNHEDLIHLDHDKFGQLMAGHQHGDISVTMTSTFGHSERGAIMY